MSEDRTSLYRAALLDLARDPRYWGPLDGAELRGRALNPLCGDELVAEATLGPSAEVDQLRYIVRGCAICQASARLVAPFAAGRRREELERAGAQLQAALEGAALPDGLESMEPLLVLRARRSRHACAMLAWQALAQMWS